MVRETTFDRNTWQGPRILAPRIGLPPRDDRGVSPSTQTDGDVNLSAMEEIMVIISGTSLAGSIDVRAALVDLLTAAKKLQAM